MLAQALLALGICLAGAETPLAGTYVVTAGQEGGKTFAQDELQQTSVVIHDNSIMVYDARTGQLNVYTFKLAPAAADGKGIDMQGVFGVEEGMEAKGIFERQDGRLKISFIPDSNTRPASFQTKEGTQQMTFEMQQVAP